MKRTALLLTLLAATAACDGATPTDISPSFDGDGTIGSGVGASLESDSGWMGSGGGRTGDDTGSTGSGCCAGTSSTEDGGIVGSGGGRTGLIGPSGG